MAKTISITYKNKTYTLEFTRDSVKQLELSKFKMRELGDYPVSMLPKLFHGAFIANHPTVKRSLTDEILDKLENKDELIEKLSDMYSDPLDTMLDDSKGNLKWEATGF